MGVDFLELQLKLRKVSVVEENANDDVASMKGNFAKFRSDLGAVHATISRQVDIDVGAVGC